MFSKIYKKRITKILSFVMILSLLQMYIKPNQLFAITSGPSQPEVQSFEPVGTNQMVDLFSGDFTYNIPLFNLPGPNGGYPFNIAYHSGIGMDQEASWVGLGWTLNPGAIVRNVRGLPDDFNGDAIKQTIDMKSNTTIGLDFGANFELFGADAGIGVNQKIYYNSYKGLGTGFGFNVTVNNDSKTCGLSLGLNTDSQGGAGINASLSLSSTLEEKEGVRGTASFGLGMSSRGGLDVTMGASVAQCEKSSKTKTTRSGEEKTKTVLSSGASLGASSVLSFGTKSYIPSISTEMTGVNLNGYIKIGTGVWGPYVDFNIGFFYNTQYVKNAGEAQSYEAYGYSYLQEPMENGKHNNEEHYILDCSREKDGMITTNSPNLPIPSLTYDYFNLQGQGIGGMIRPFRNDVGHIHDQFLVSKDYSGSLGAEIAVHFGVSGSYSYSETGNGDFAEDGFEYVFEGDDASDVANYEPVYYAIHGDQVAKDTSELDYILGEDPVYIPIANKGIYTSKLVNEEDEELTDLVNVRNNGERNPRSSVIHTYTNEELGSSASRAALGEFNVSFTDESGTTENIREYRNATSIEHHIGGITALNAEGMRYNYGIATYNNEQREYLYSADNDNVSSHCDIEYPIEDGSIDYDIDYTDEFEKITETPAYATSYLLTSVLGPDYVDLTNDGPTDDDLGYWVKFNYVLKETDYGWRAPYKNSNYAPGLISFIDDDKASFIYGTKEIWHLESVETKTHIAKFNLSDDEREDARGTTEFNNSIASESFVEGSGISYALDNIVLYSKEDETEPIKTVHFEYSYDLCQNVENNSVADSGKLTLERLWFTYENSKRGELNDYEFSYEENPEYSKNNYDRWGNYKSDGTACERKHFPYVNQDPSGSQQTDAAAWNLSGIKLPSGGIINIKYESDDYAYVQNRVANQMFKISSLKDGEGSNVTFDATWSKSEGANDNWRKVYFDLETPYDSADHARFFDEYIKELARIKGAKKYYQLFYKVKARLRGNYYEYVAGYIDLDTTGGAGTAYGVEDVDNDSEEKCEKGFITVKGFQPDTDEDKYYHPFAAAAWQFIRTNKPELMVTPGTMDDMEPASDAAAKSAQAKSLYSVFNSIKSIFVDYTTTAFNKRWGNQIVLDESYIRLCTPDKIKYGGGCRVSQVSLSDNWNETTGEADAVYGQVYDYTMVEDDEVISSGVATNEPELGGDENALRYAKSYSNNVPMKSPNNLFFEYPINASLYPGPSVGYRKVTVRSIATSDLQTEEEKTGSGGITVNEFYTAKDFPVITDETDLTDNKRSYKLTVLVPLIGTLETFSLTASQGYSIKLNDMHGKPKSITSYSVDENGDIAEEVNKVEYYYQKDERMYEGEMVYETDNVVDIYNGFDTPYTAALGTEVDFTTDMRHSYTSAVTGGVNANIDFITAIFIPVPIPSVWPSISKLDKDLWLAVTNKAIFKPGIIDSVSYTSFGSRVTTKNLLYDKATGQPLMTRTTNSFDKPVYNLNLPAYEIYEGMGEAYPNDGLSFSATQTAAGSEDDTYVLSLETEDEGKIEYLNPGDELIVNNYSKATILSVDDNTITVYSGNSISSDYSTDFKVARSGKRNLLGNSRGAIASLSNPVENYTTSTESYSVMVPNKNEESSTLEAFLKVVSEWLEDNSIDEKYMKSQLKKCIDSDLDAFRIRFEYLEENYVNIVISADDVDINIDLMDDSSEDLINANEVIGFTDIKALTYNEDQDNAYCTYLFDDNITKEGWIYISGSPLPKEGDVTYDFDYNTLSKTGDLIKLDSVLNISAVSYTDKWNKGSGSTNPYATGEAGIWSPDKTYAYFADSRENSGTLASDGMMNAVPVYSWEAPFAGLFNSQWKATQEITRINTASSNIPVETKDILGRYSAALYGYSGNEVIMVANNARYSEIGFQGFEDILSPNTYTSSSSFTFKDGNLEFSSISDTQESEEVYSVDIGYGSTAVVDLTYNENRSFNNIRVKALLEATETLESEQIIVTTDADAYEGESSDKTVLDFDDFDDEIFTSDRLWNGSIHLVEEHDIQNCSSSSVIEGVSHSGTKSLYVSSTASTCSVSMNILKHVAGDSYVISYWAKNESGGNSQGIVFYDSDDEELESYVILATGTANVDGWQKYELTYTVPDDANYYNLVFNNDSYIDDIRIHPVNASVKTFVYNPVNLKLLAVLDENNYASYYYYDEEGNLFLVKKETEDGIRTIQESRSHLPE